MTPGRAADAQRPRQPGTRSRFVPVYINVPKSVVLNASTRYGLKHRAFTLMTNVPMHDSGTTRPIVYLHTTVL